MFTTMTMSIFYCFSLFILDMIDTTKSRDIWNIIVLMTFLSFISFIIMWVIFFMFKINHFDSSSYFVIGFVAMVLFIFFHVLDEPGSVKVLTGKSTSISAALPSPLTFISKTFPANLPTVLLLSITLTTSPGLK